MTTMRDIVYFIQDFSMIGGVGWGGGIQLSFPQDYSQRCYYDLAQRISETSVTIIQVVAEITLQ